jgi:hypothetical protein
MIEQRFDVLAPFGERRHMDRDHQEPKMEILTKPPGAPAVRDRRGRDHPDLRLASGQRASGARTI